VARGLYVPMTSLSIDGRLSEWERVADFRNLFCLFNCSRLIFPPPFSISRCCLPLQAREKKRGGDGETVKRKAEEACALMLEWAGRQRDWEGDDWWSPHLIGNLSIFGFISKFLSNQ
jgi:hypothetical protein